MKKIYSFLLGLATLSYSNAQTVKASIGVGSTPNRLAIYLMPDATQNASISTLQFNVGIRDSLITTPPTATVFTHGFGAAAWQVTPAYSEGGYWNYNIYTATSPLTPSFTANTEFPAMEIEFSGGVPETGRAGLVTLPDGGTQTSFALFYCSGSISSNGQNNLYYARAGVAIDNQNSYDPNFIQPGVATSFATFPSQVLPVKFLNFAVAKNNNTALLTWSVENEDANTDSYEILKSVNGVDFTSLTTLAPANNGRSSNTYNFTVENLSSIRSTGVIYFRIKQIDKDGKATYTDIKNVRLNGKGLSVAVYPNPVKNSANVTFDMEDNSEVTIAVVDALGKQLSVKSLKGVKGANITSVDMSKLAAGNYTLKLQTTTETKVVPVVKAQN